MKKYNVVVVGLGYVGLPLALLASEKGHTVTGVDIDKKKIDLLNQDTMPFVDEELGKELKKTQMRFTTEATAVRDADVVIICVPTPVHKDKMPNLTPVISACVSVAPYMKKGQLIILESTVNPGVSEGIVQPELEKGSGLKAGEDFYLAHCPERINPGDTKWTIRNIPRVVGSLDAAGLEIALDFYRSIIEADIKPMGSLKEAEAVKIVENSFRDINIAFVNELAQSFSELGIDVVNVIDGAATKPFSFMAHYPGVGVGGHCIPVDPYYMIEYAKKTSGFQHDFMSLARRINSGMPRFTASLVMRGLNEVRRPINGTRVAVLGLAYKSNIDDMRESPSFELIKELEKLGASVVAFDPFVPSKSTVSTLQEALEKSEAVVIATAHDVFKNLTPSEMIGHGIKVVIDGRNCLPKEVFRKSGIVYKGIGI